MDAKIIEIKVDVEDIQKRMLEAYEDGDHYLFRELAKLQAYYENIL